ncbi:MAG: hypothetical protein HYT97_00440 [Elusimicrobia bacterium]|nr:hypothetical protein [Elusimicrobiota bacterium]
MAESIKHSKFSKSNSALKKNHQDLLLNHYSNWWIGSGILWSYFVIYKYLQQYPLDIRNFESLLPVKTFFPTLSILFFYLKGLAVWLGIVSGALTLGYYFLKTFKIKWNSSLEQFTFSVVIGQAFIAFIFLCLSALHFLYFPLIIIFWFSCWISFSWCFLKNSNGRTFLKEGTKEISVFCFGSAQPFILRLFLWIFLSVSFVMALVPEVFYDSLVYHLGIPNLFLQEKGIVRVSGAVSKFPMILQTLYLFGLALHDEMVPKLIHWFNGVLILFGFGTFTKRLGLAIQVGLIASIFFISVPMVQMNLWTSGIDISSCLFAFFAAYALCLAVEGIQNQNQQDESSSWVILSALLCGFAYGSKYQGGIMAGTLFLSFFLFHLVLNPNNYKIFLRQSFFFILVFGLAISPWLLKNLWDTGNPVFPFLSALFKKFNLQNYFLDPDQWQIFINENRRFITESWKENWTLPWKLTFKDRNQSGLSFPGPLFLTLLPLSLLSIQYLKREWNQIIFLFLAFFFVASFNSTHLTRYHLQGYPLLCFIYALGFYIALQNKNFLIKIFFLIPVILVLTENLQTCAFIIKNSYSPGEVLSGRESREDYKMVTHPGLNPYPANVMFRWMENTLPKTTRTLFIGDSKTYDLKLPYLYTDVHGQNPLIGWVNNSNSSEELLKHFQNSGITHILINFNEARRTYGYKMLKWNKEKFELFELFWNDYVKEKHREVIPERFFPRNSLILLYEIQKIKNENSKQNTESSPIFILEQLNKK